MHYKQRFSEGMISLDRFIEIKMILAQMRRVDELKSIFGFVSFICKFEK